MTEPWRPLIRWYGGKWRLAPWIIEQFPKHKVYVEPFAGGGSVLLQKPRSYAEILNDLDGSIVNLYAVLRSPQANELVRQIRLTPFSREELKDAYEATPDPVESARRLIVRSFLGFGVAGAIGRVTGFRSNSNRSGTTPAHDWVNYPDALVAIIERLKGVVIEKRPAIEVMEVQDSADTLHYLDPPYVSDTRSQKKLGDGLYHSYNHELTDADHAELLAFIQTLEGYVVLSGYPSEMYDDALSRWHRIERDALADGAAPRTEVLWINPRCWRAKTRENQPLFASLEAH